MRFLNPDDRMSVVGRTGTGKTVGAAFQALYLPWDDYLPLLFYDYKGDRLISEIGAHEDVHHITTDRIPDEAGLWIVRPRPDQDEEVEEQLWRIWERGGIGVVIDEGYMITGSDAYRAILQQGRSKGIPVITLSQRPVFMDMFSFTEASFFQIYDLSTKGDRKRIVEYVPGLDGEEWPDLPKYHSIYYDVAENRIEVLRPVPPPDEIVRRFHERLDAMRPPAPRTRAFPLST